jgi:hypothetical protein
MYKLKGGCKLISCDGWPDCYQECNAFKPHCRDAITGGNRGKLFLVAKGRGPEISLPHPEEKARHKEAAMLEGMKGDIIHKISLQRHRRPS